MNYTSSYSDYKERTSDADSHKSDAGAGAELAPCIPQSGTPS